MSASLLPSSFLKKPSAHLLGLEELGKDLTQGSGSASQGPWISTSRAQSPYPDVPATWTQRRGWHLLLQAAGRCMALEEHGAQAPALSLLCTHRLPGQAAEAPLAPRSSHV